LVKPHDGTLRRAALYLAGGSSVAVLFSIAVSHILLVAALLTLLASRQWPAIPPVWLPLVIFLGGTVLSLLASPEPLAGLPQIRKFFVYSVLIAVYTTFRGARDVRQIFVIWGALATASALWSFVQFWQKRTEAASQGLDFYLHYVGNRVTGFMSHWMTFSGEQMVAVLLLMAMLLFGVVSRWFWMAGAVIGASIAIAWTRSVWLGSAVGAIYLVAAWRPKLLLLVPVAFGAAFLAAPPPAQKRILSIYQPQGATDSNEHRRITLRTGLEMIKAHPLLGVGPQRVGSEFMNYLPPDIPRPLPEGYYEHLHNIYVHYAAERGIPTMLALLWLIGKVLADFVRGVRRLAPGQRLERAILHGAIACILAILVEGFFEYNLNDTEVLTMFLVVVAAGYVTVREALHA
jgi:O-antigen ligase